VSRNRRPSEVVALCNDALAAALRIVRRTQDHRASGVVLISGDPGIGKTAVLSEGARQATHMRMRVARGNCDEIGQAWPGALILGLLRAGRDPLIAAPDFEALTELTGTRWCSTTASLTISKRWQPRIEC
jgi:predicted ATPase